MESKEKDIEKYLEDINTIKSLLIKADEKPLVEYWAFITWGIFIILGTIIHFIAEKYFSFTNVELTFEIWIPVMVVAGIFESIALVQNTNKESIPLVSRLSVKLFLAFILLSTIFIILFNMLLKEGLEGYIPEFLSFMVGAYFIIFATLSYTPIFLNASILIVYGTLLYFMDFQSDIISLVTGGVIAGNFIAAGIKLKLDLREK
jgi:hypothetical protein